MPKYEIIEQGFAFQTVEADTAEEALEQVDEPDRIDYTGGDEPRGNVYVDWYARNVDDPNDRVERSFTLPEPEPECSHDDGHDWQSPHEIVGGCRESPGVRGNAGGVIVTEVCMHCGCARRTNTWAQRSDTGEQGLEEVTYEPGRYASEIAGDEAP